MGTVVRDRRLADRSGRRWATRRSRTGAAGIEPVGHELHTTPRELAPGSRLRGHATMVLVLLLVVGVWAWWLGAERRAVQALPPDERAALYDQTMHSFADLCRPPRTGLEQHCRREASFLLYFPECDERCVSLARPILRWRS